ncbi:MAG TPA: hypothetical protein VL422_06240, partial [Miltoncostaea sp.]|nr:hypothetical protein [Miltoncostaea sp.]
LRAAYGDALTVTPLAEGRARLEGIGPAPVHAVEVHWADLLDGEAVRGTFDYDRIWEVVWFPRLNQRCGILPPEVCPPARVTRWTVVLAPLTALLYATYTGTRMLASPFIAADAPPDLPPSRKPSRFDDLMDRVTADVFNYADGLRGAYPDGDRHAALAARVREIRVRFEHAAEAAVEAGCREIQVVAHSLGTVVAFTSMNTAPGTSPAGDPPALITRLYTIGSPLEKFRFFWTPLLAGSEGGPVISSAGRAVAASGDPPMRWDNFSSRLDLVSGRLHAFPGWPEAENHAVPGLGGLMNSHTAYNGNAAFLATLGEGLGGPPPPDRPSRARRVRRAVWAAVQNLALPLGLLVLAAIGLGLMLAIGWGVGWVLGRPLDWLGFDTAARWVANGFALFVVATVAVQAYSGALRAREIHARFWADAPPGTVSG